MDVATIVAVAAAAFGALGVGITLIVFVVRGGFLLGRLFTQVEALGSQVEGLTAAISELRAEMQQSNQELRAEMQQSNQSLAAAISELRTEVQQSNQTLAALANHTHDTDGRTVFQVPPAAAR